MDKRYGPELSVTVIGQTSATLPAGEQVLTAMGLLRNCTRRSLDLNLLQPRKPGDYPVVMISDELKPKGSVFGAPPDEAPQDWEPTREYETGDLIKIEGVGIVRVEQVPTT